ncbi:MAG: surface-adhesin E family protein [Nitrospirota bacterium]
MLLRAVLIIFLLVSCSTMQNKSHNWRLYHETEYYSYYYDADSIVLTGSGTQRLQIRLIGRSSSITSETEIDCSKKMARIISHAIFDAELKVLNTMAYDVIVWDNIVPDSAGDSLFRAICKE